MFDTRYFSKGHISLDYKYYLYAKCLHSRVESVSIIVFGQSGLAMTEIQLTSETSTRCYRGAAGAVSEATDSIWYQASPERIKQIRIRPSNHMK